MVSTAFGISAAATIPDTHSPTTPPMTAFISNVDHFY
jgi:hypothetical protein